MESNIIKIMKNMMYYKFTKTIWKSSIYNMKHLELVQLEVKTRLMQNWNDFLKTH